MILKRRKSENHKDMCIRSNRKDLMRDWMWDSRGRSVKHELGFSNLGTQVKKLISERQYNIRSRFHAINITILDF